MKWLMFLIVFVFKSAAAADCVETVERVANIQLQVINSISDNCFVTVTPRKIELLTYRSYLVSSDGELMIFNSYGPGDEAKTTGAREFFFFPRSQQPSYFFNGMSRRLEITMSNRDVIHFDYDTADITFSSRGKLNVSKTISVGDNGGVEFESYDGLRLDSGFRLGSAPSGNSKGNSVFVDRFGVKCQVKNSLLFRYFGDGDVQFKHTDESLNKLLKQNCPKLSI